jgi:predicted Zn finger-like uncharacterized protein
MDLEFRATQLTEAEILALCPRTERIDGARDEGRPETRRESTTAHCAWVSTNRYGGQGASMTIRKYLKNQFWKMALTLVLPLAAFELFIRHMPNFSLNSPWVWAVMPLPYVLLTCVVWAFYQAVRFVCPRCGTWIPATSAAIGIGRLIRRCPKCGVNFDEPIEPAKVGWEPAMTIKDYLKRRGQRMQLLVAGHPGRIGGSISYATAVAMVHPWSASAWNILPAVSMSAYAMLASGSAHDRIAVATWRSLVATLASSRTAAPAIERCTAPRPSNAAWTVVKSVWFRCLDCATCNSLIASQM